MCTHDLEKECSVVTYVHGEGCMPGSHTFMGKEHCLRVQSLDRSQTGTESWPSPVLACDPEQPT